MSLTGKTISSCIACLGCVVETVNRVTGQCAASCYSGGYGETCQVGIPWMILGEGVNITADSIPDVAKQPKVMDAVAKTGQLLGKRPRNGHNRERVTQRMQEKMMAMFESSA